MITKWVWGSLLCLPKVNRQKQLDSVYLRSVSVGWIWEQSLCRCHSTGGSRFSSHDVALSDSSCWTSIPHPMDCDWLPSSADFGCCGAGLRGRSLHEDFGERFDSTSGSTLDVWSLVFGVASRSPFANDNDWQVKGIRVGSSQLSSPSPLECGFFVFFFFVKDFYGEKKFFLQRCTHFAWWPTVIIRSYSLC